MLLFQKQWVLLFSKSKMATTNFRNSGGVTRQAKFIIKTKNIFSKNPGVLQTRPCSVWLAPIHYLQTRCVCTDEGRGGVFC